MGRAIVRKPSAFLMDEPLSNLDAKLRVQMRAEIGRLQREFHTTTIYVTHDQVEAMTMGDRVAVLNGGRIEQCDRPRDLYDRPANLFVAAFIGSPSMNIVPAVDRAVARRASPPSPPASPCPLDESRVPVDRPRGSGGRSPSASAPRRSPRLRRTTASPQVSGTVAFVEELGSEVLVHVHVAGLGSSTAITAARAEASDDREVVARTGEPRRQAAGAHLAAAGRPRSRCSSTRRERALLRSGRAVAAHGVRQ